MRKLTITDTQGNELGSITEGDDGVLSGEGKAVSLLEQAPGKSFDEWIENGHHSKYLRYVDDSAAA